MQFACWKYSLSVGEKVYQHLNSIVTIETVIIDKKKSYTDINKRDVTTVTSAQSNFRKN